MSNLDLVLSNNKTKNINIYMSEKQENSIRDWNCNAYNCILTNHIYKKKTKSCEIYIDTFTLNH